MVVLSYSEIMEVDNWQELYVQRFLGEEKQQQKWGPCVFQILYDLKGCIRNMKRYWNPKY